MRRDAMKKIMILLPVLFCYLPIYSQDCCDKVAKQGVEIYLYIDSLSNARDSIQLLESNNNLLEEQMQNMREDSLEVATFKIEKINMEKQLQQKKDSIEQLKKNISLEKRKIEDCKRDGQQRAQEQYVHGQQEVYNKIADYYVNTNSLDELIRSSTKYTIVRDSILLSNNEKALQKIQYLQRYFYGLSILDDRFSSDRLELGRDTLSAITEESQYLEKLKTNLSKYEQFTEGLKSTIRGIIEIDENEIANSEAIQELKFQKILSELSFYIFYNGINFRDYPYLSGIILEIIMRKQPDANADISDLLEKL